MGCLGKAQKMYHITWNRPVGSIANEDPENEDPKAEDL